MRVPTINGDGPVRLAPLEPAQVTEAYVGWLNDPVVTRFTEVSAGQTLQSARAYVENTVTSPDSALWAIHFDGTHVGNIRLTHIRRRHARAEVALIVGSRPHWGRGIASAAVVLVTDFAFASLRLHKLSAGIFAPNVASRRCFEKAGYFHDAILKDHAWFEGAFCDVLQMARLAPPSSPSSPHAPTEANR